MDTLGQALAEKDTAAVSRAGKREAPPALSLSPSRAADFMSCPLLYRFRTVDRLPEPPSSDATRGTVVHGVLERLFDLPAAERTPEQAVGMVRPEWERLLSDEPELAGLFTDDEDGSALQDWLSSAEGLVQRYFTLEDPQRLEPAERELYVETTLDSGLRLRGYVDRLDRAPATGELRVVDYKTGKAPRAGFEQRAMFQMRFYALVLWRLHGQVPRLLQLVYLGSGEILRYEPDEADLRATERKLAALWNAIERSTNNKDWRPNPSRLCDWCAHQAICPAYGGTPPPVPERSLVDDSAETEAPTPRTSVADL
ncbi:PD-(D/E)XK nuclease family protein [Phytoactinopolyspora alkaliphila]|uniref:PD-(D/E)XK nuclease family protein n=1 Tax=Phytoactinopolyspora alkaliphila TaxID=1783498 RepID=A0A6N9YH60_9ACTN|nr:PD-(D/E)XK nuclease family protein [Phytoactinopolyspora alkaliphila]NED94219.1 PD-(D/E)XK nuclease family protein [Phytoactinopolyspora alkaliphila]